jgi:hypothetical protein
MLAACLPEHLNPALVLAVFVDSSVVVAVVHGVCRGFTLCFPLSLTATPYYQLFGQLFDRTGMLSLRSLLLLSPGCWTVKNPRASESETNSLQEVVEAAASVANSVTGRRSCTSSRISPYSDGYK